ncbi:hypothetical protein FHG87_015909 [Trinorchestia longiramus]|nr:hypothetical protein FHG87_015909 [Trinorchestia longiramus]
MQASSSDLQFTSSTPAAMNVLVIFACLIVSVAARPQQYGFDMKALQTSFNNLPNTATAFETEGAVGGLAKVGDRIAEVILQNTPAERQASMKRIIEMSGGFMDSIGNWVNELPPSALEVPQVTIPQVVIPEFEVPENWQFPDIPVPEINIPEVPTFNRN